MICNYLQEDFFFFFNKIKWNILSTQQVVPSTRCDQEKQKSPYNIYNLKKEKQKRKKERKKLYVVQYYQGTKPPAMVKEDFVFGDMFFVHQRNKSLYIK